MRHRSIFLAATLMGCAGSVVVDGYSLNRSSWERDSQAIRQRASFDLHCQPDQLTLHVLDTFSGSYARQVGVQGCGHQAVYVDPAGTYMWVANSTSSQQ